MKKERFFENAQEGWVTFMALLLCSKKSNELRGREGLDQNFIIKNHRIKIQRKKELYLLLFLKIREPDVTKIIVGVDYC